MFDDIRCEKVLVKLPGLLDLAKKKKENYHYVRYVAVLITSRTTVFSF